MSKSTKSATFASAALAVALSAPTMSADAPAGSVGAAIGAGDKVHCYGVHSCAGNSDCKTAEHSCKGKNSCGGHGFKAMTAQQCLESEGVIADIQS